MTTIEDRLYSITERLTALFPKKIDLSLGRIERFLKQIDNPHLNIPPAIHVAGTNGKGSTIAFLRSCLEHLDYTCHAMTSPHLVRFNERIILAGDEITTDHFMELLDECENINAGESISYFEMVIAATFLAFSRTSADISLVETGLGGRLDATNVLQNPLATIITTISFDHTDYLGNTLTDIASEKAGIMKEKVPCIIGAQTQEALDAGIMAVFENHAQTLNVPLLRFGHEWNTQETSTGFTLTLNNKTYDFPVPSLLGAHQIKNVGAVLVTLLTTYPASDIQKLSQAIQNTTWRGRLQRLNTYNEKYGEVWLDGGHNDSAGQVLADQAIHWSTQDKKPLHLIIGMVNRKNPEDFLTPLLPHLASITVIDIPHAEASWSAHALSEIIKPFATCPVNTATSPDEALMAQGKDTRILIAGSLYLAGAILADIENKVPQKNEW